MQSYYVHPRGVFYKISRYQNHSDFEWAGYVFYKEDITYIVPYFKEKPMDLIQQGLDEKLIKFDDERKYITYLYHKIRRNYSNLEEKVQAESFLKLGLTYNFLLQNNFR